MSFKDIVGQKAAVRILQDELEDGRVQHAYLFLGKDGVGKKALALELTKAILCEKKDIDSCGSCLACRKIDHSNHPDLGVLTVEEGRSIKIDQIRSLQKDIAYKPYESQKRIYIIEDADKMTPEAANCLLKTLEEPPGYAVIILLAEEIDRLLPTVISRCQEIQLRTIPENMIKRELINTGYKEDLAEILARLADGSLGTAFKLAEDEDFFDNRTRILKILCNLPEMNSFNIFKNVDFLMDILKNKDDFPLFHLILSWYRDIILYNQGYKEKLVNTDYIERLQQQKDIYSLPELIAIVELVNKIKSYVDRSVKKDLALQVMLFKIRAKRVK